MSYVFCSEVVKKVNSGTEEQKKEAILILNFEDYLELRQKAARGSFGVNTFCGVETKVTHKCPQGKFYLVRRNKP